MAPGAELVTDEQYSTISQNFAQALKDFDQGTWEERLTRIEKLKTAVRGETGFSCPHCGVFAGGKVENLLANAAKETRKKAFEIKRKSVQMYLLIHPDWLKGDPGRDEHGAEYGGYAGAPP